MNRPRVATEGGAAVVRQGLGEMPLTLWLIVAAVILYLYIRRANLGIDLHPSEGKSVTIKPKPAVIIAPRMGQPTPAYRQDQITQ